MNGTRFCLAVTLPHQSFDEPIMSRGMPMTIDRPKRDKKRGAGRVRTSGDQTRGETVKIKPKDEHACRTKNIKPRRV
jgi:hypothetical protein